MCKVLEDMINEEIREIAIRMLERGKMSIEEIVLLCQDLVQIKMRSSAC